MSLPFKWLCSETGLSTASFENKCFNCFRGLASGGMQLERRDKSQKSVSDQFQALFQLFPKKGQAGHVFVLSRSCIACAAFARSGMRAGAEILVRGRQHICQHRLGKFRVKGSADHRTV